MAFSWDLIILTFWGCCGAMSLFFITVVFLQFCSSGFSPLVFPVNPLVFPPPPLSFSRNRESSLQHPALFFLSFPSNRESSKQHRFQVSQEECYCNSSFAFGTISFYSPLGREKTGKFHKEVNTFRC